MDIEMEMEIRDEIEKVLRQMCLGRNYRGWSEETIDRIYPHIEYIIEVDLEGQDEDVGRLEVDEDMVITAMMMELEEGY